MRIAFYAPLKPPDHPVPSGDRRMAQLLGLALTQAGHDVELAARLRSYEGGGDIERQRRLAEIGGKLAARLGAALFDRPAAQRPHVWLTYHLYYKAPDWIGPRAAAQLGIPYLVVEASVAMKRAGGPWSFGHEAVLAALKRADSVISLNPKDEDGVRPHVSGGHRMYRLKPFLESAPFAAAARNRLSHRLGLARRFKLQPDAPWLVTVAMMRSGDKLASYRVLGAALQTLLARSWQLLVVGDGAARPEVAAALAPLGERVIYAGALAPEEMPAVLAAADLFAWPAINEAYGMAILEAQAAGLPVVAGASGGVPELVADGCTGMLTTPGSASAFAQVVEAMLDHPERRRRYSEGALQKVASQHDLPSAGKLLDLVLRATLGPVT
jgi:glycosyltransferase involved in cell wall biosynthesis